MKKIIMVVFMLFSAHVLASDYSPPSVYNANLNGNLNKNGNKNINGNLNKNINKNAATGIGVGVGIGKGGSVDSRIKNTVSNKQGQLQGQKQGQLQGQLQGQKQSANNSQSQGANNKQGQSVHIQDNSFYEAQDRDPVSSAIAPGLTSGVDTCMGSTSLGGQGVGFGLSFGTTWVDEHCKLIKATKLLQGMGLNKAAVARMCLDEDLAFALKAEGQGYCEAPAVGGGADDGLPMMESKTEDWFDTL